jgi:isoleucyl-tRNA synthetase
LRAFPTPRAELRDPELEQRVAIVRRAVALGLSLRERERIGTRRPLSSLTVASPDQAVRQAIESHRADLLGELNVKAVHVVADDSALVTLSAKANFKRLGSRLGKRMKSVASAVQHLDGRAVRALLQGESIEVEGEQLSVDDVLVQREPLPGRVVESEGALSVVLDTTLDEGLRHEGLVRELINRVQGLRKSARLEVSDRIMLNVSCDGELGRALDNGELTALLRGETLAHEVGRGAGALHAHAEAGEIDGEPVVISLQRAE